MRAVAQELADDLEVPLLGKVPLVPQLREGADSGNPIVVSDPDDEASKIFRVDRALARPRAGPAPGLPNRAQDHLSN